MRYAFGNYILDIPRRELRDPRGVVAIEPQVFDLLEFLVRHRDRMVTRDDLIAAVWGGRIVSESTIATRINAARRAIGDDGTSQQWIKTVARKGFRFVGEVRDDVTEAKSGARASSELRAQHISFCRTDDGVNIAVASVGTGPTLVKTANWLNHLEYDWQSPIWSPFYGRLAARFCLVRYDGRSNGMSDREVQDISFAGFERDLDAVVDTLGLQRFALLGMSQGAAAAIGYAVRHAERVSRLILYGAYAQGRNKRGSPQDATTAQTVLSLMREGWGREDSPFMRAFSTLYLPGGAPEQIRWFADLQRLSATGEMAARVRVACDDIDVTALLPRVTVPTLVLHATRDSVASIEQGRMIAATIPRARFVTLDSENHVPIHGDPAWERLVAEIEAFAALE